VVNALTQLQNSWFI